MSDREDEAVIASRKSRLSMRGDVEELCRASVLLKSKLRRRMFLMAFQDGLSNGDIAELVGVNEYHAGRMVRSAEVDVRRLYLAGRSGGRNSSGMRAESKRRK